MTEPNQSAIQGRSALVVAHPDDEILWFSSVLRDVDEVIICFRDVPSRPDWTSGRRRAEESFPLTKATFLGLTESEVFNGADWRAPVVTATGVDIKRRENVLAGYDAQRYYDNFDQLCSALSQRLKGISVVFTHNPWGEYGHEEHVQVYRAVSHVRPSVGFDVRYSNYCSTRSYHLMLQHIAGFHSNYVTRETQPALAKSIEEHYRRNGCWTWPFEDYVWFTHECFMQDESQRPAPSASGHIFPLNFIKIEVPWSNVELRTRGSMLRRAIGKLRRIGH